MLGRVHAMTVLRPVSGTSLVTEVFDKVVEAITSGAFEPGQKLSEADLARQLGISRGPLREALGRLEGKLVTRTPRLGVRVVDFSRPVVEQFLYVREALEGMAARLAAENADGRQLDTLEELVSSDEGRPEAPAGEAYFRGKAALVEHRQILSALQARDPDAAERAMRLHVRNARLSMLAELPPSAAGKPMLRTA